MKNKVLTMLLVIAGTVQLVEAHGSGHGGHGGHGFHGGRGGYWGGGWSGPYDCSPLDPFCYSINPSEPEMTLGSMGSTAHSSKMADKKAQKQSLKEEIKEIQSSSKNQIAALQKRINALKRG